MIQNLSSLINKEFISDLIEKKQDSKGRVAQLAYSPTKGWYENRLSWLERRVWKALPEWLLKICCKEHVIETKMAHLFKHRDKYLGSDLLLARVDELFLRIYIKKHNEVPPEGHFFTSEHFKDQIINDLNSLKDLASKLKKDIKINRILFEDIDSLLESQSRLKTYQLHSKDEALKAASKETQTSIDNAKKSLKTQFDLKKADLEKFKTEADDDLKRFIEKKLIALGIMSPVKHSMLPVCGINNGGNNCYMNSALQILVNNDGIVQMIYKLGNGESLGKLEDGEKLEDREAFRLNKQALLNHLKTFLTAYQVHSSPATLKALMLNIRTQLQLMYPLSFPNGPTAQYDSLEMIGLIFDALEINCFNMIENLSYQPYGSHDKKDPAKLLYVPLQGLSLKECLDSYFMKDEIRDPKEYYCLERPGEKSILVPYDLQNFIQDPLPEILLVQIKRFQTTKVGEEFVTTKIATALSVDEIVDVGPYLKDAEGRKVEYQIESVVFHRGPSVHGGHYVAKAKRDGQWYLMDDNNQVCKTDANDLGDAYGFVLRKVPV